MPFMRENKSVKIMSKKGRFRGEKKLTQSIWEKLTVEAFCQKALRVTKPKNPAQGHGRVIHMQCVHPVEAIHVFNQ